MVTPWSVRSPVTFAWSLPAGATLVETKVIAGYFPASSHWSPFSSSVSLALVVVTEATGIFTESFEAAGFFGSRVRLPDTSEKPPA